MITTIDPTDAVIGKIVAALKADAALNAIVPAARVFPSKTPAALTWPFIRIGDHINTPNRLDGGSGGDVSGVVHCFTKASTSTPDAQKQARQINAHIARIIDATEALQADELDVSIHVTLTQVIPDAAEADAFHGIVSISASAT